MECSASFLDGIPTGNAGTLTVCANASATERGLCARWDARALPYIACRTRAYPPLRRAPCLMVSRTCGMVIHMKTTLNIDDTVMASLRREAARTGRTMSELVETALRQLLRRAPAAAELPPLPSFQSGGALVDVSDREALYRQMEGR